MTITRESLLTLEAYSKIRKTARTEAIAHRKVRSVALGEHVTLQFELVPEKWTPRSLLF